MTRPSVDIETTTSDVSSPDPRSFSIHLMCHTGAVCLPGVWLSNERLIKILLPLYGYTVESLELVLA